MISEAGGAFYELPTLHHLLLSASSGCLPLSSGHTLFHTSPRNIQIAWVLLQNYLNSEQQVSPTKHLVLQTPSTLWPLSVHGYKQHPRG